MKNQTFRYQQVKMDRDIVELLNEIRTANTLIEVRKIIDNKITTLYQRLGILETLIW